MRTFVADAAFAALFAQTPAGPRVAHAPTIFLDDDTIGIHLARGNTLTKHLDGTSALLVVQGPDAYVSPDWYGMADQVPTWNYVAVELDVTVSRMERDALADQVRALSAAREAKLTPKPVWTAAKMTPGLFDKMLAGIVGFRLDIRDWRGTAKLGQNKPESARLGAADAIEANGGVAIAALMRSLQS